MRGINLNNRLKKGSLSSSLIIGANIILLLIGILRIKYINFYYGLEFNGLYQFSLQFVRCIELADVGYTSIFVSLLYKAISNDNKDLITKLIRSCNYWQNHFTKLMVLFLSAIILIILFFVNDPNYSSINVALVTIITSIPILFDHLLKSRLAYLIAAQKQYKSLAPLLFGKSIIFIISISLMKHFSSYVFLIFESSAYLLLLFIFFEIAKKENEKIMNENLEFELVKLDYPKAMIGVKIADLLNKNTDNISIGFVKGISAVGVVAPYFYILNSLISLFWSFGDTIKTTLGDMIANNVFYFKKYFYGFISFLFCIAGILSLSVFVGADSFVRIFYYSNTDSLVFGDLALSISLILFFQIFFSFLKMIIEIKILWKKIFKLYLIEALINVILSIILLKVYGISGAYWATVITFLLINIPVSISTVCDELGLNKKYFILKIFAYIFVYLVLLIITSRIKVLFSNVDSLLSWSVVLIFFNVGLTLILFSISACLDKGFVDIILRTFRGLRKK